MNKYPWHVLIVGFVVLGVDQLSKWVILNYFPYLIVWNYHGALGVMPWWVSLIGLIFLGGYLFSSYSFKVVHCRLASIRIFFSWSSIMNLDRDCISFLVLVAIWMGGFGNVIDRILYGAVVDFIAIWQFPVFNIADVVISVGAGVLGLLNVKK